jgi:hypothetical protein
MNELANIHKQFPQFRFGQFLFNACNASGHSIFYIDDSELLYVVQQYAKQLKQEPFVKSHK